MVTGFVKPTSDLSTVDATFATPDTLVQTTATQANGAMITDSTTAIIDNKTPTLVDPVTNSPDTLITVNTAEKGMSIRFL